MKMIIHYDGNTYETPSTDEATVADCAEALYSDLQRMNKLKIELKDGGFLLLGEQAVRRCAIMVLDS
jgi:hypothetical protein